MHRFPLQPSCIHKIYECLHSTVILNTKYTKSSDVFEPFSVFLAPFGLLVASNYTVWLMQPFGVSYSKNMPCDTANVPVRLTRKESESPDRVLNFIYSYNHPKTEKKQDLNDNCCLSTPSKSEFVTSLHCP